MPYKKACPSAAAIEAPKKSISDATAVILISLIDPVTTIIALRKAHADGDSHAGINVYEGGVVDMQAANVLEPVRVVEQAIQSATETAIMILRIDDVISSKGVSMADGFGGEDDFHM